MINYLLIIVGLILVFFGLRQLMRFTVELNQKIKRLQKILNDQRFARLETINEELDELNYSYYEILEEQNARLSALENNVAKAVKADKSTATIASPPANPAIRDKDTEPNKPINDNQRVIGLIKRGFTDIQIAKILNMGSGQVALIRTLYADFQEDAKKT